MQRFTISLDEELAAEFDRLIGRHGYENRSEAVRDLIRARLGDEVLANQQARWCVATVTYVYDRREKTMANRLSELKHQHHNVVVSAMETLLDHDNCLETVVLKGRTDAVQEFANRLIALRGVRHGRVHHLGLEEDKPHTHSSGAHEPHRHLRPAN